MYKYTNCSTDARKLVIYSAHKCTLLYCSLIFGTLLEKDKWVHSICRIYLHNNTDKFGRHFHTFVYKYTLLFSSLNLHRKTMMLELCFWPKVQKVFIYCYLQKWISSAHSITVLRHLQPLSLSHWQCIIVYGMVCGVNMFVA